MPKPQGPFAFPLESFDYEGRPTQRGMSLQDFFASMALAGLVTRKDALEDIAGLIDDAYTIADLMVDRWAEEQD